MGCFEGVKDGFELGRRDGCCDGIKMGCLEG